MPQVPLTDCPGCGYSLQGLPVRYRCPECAFEYDEHTRVWKPARPWAIYFGILVTNSVLLTQLFGFKFGFDPPWFGLFMLFSALLAAVVLGGTLIAARRNNVMGRFIVIAPNGLHARISTGSVSIAWNSIRQIRRRVDGTIELTGETPQATQDGLKLFQKEVFGHIVDPIRDSREFCGFAQAAIERYRAAAATTQSQPGAASPVGAA